MTNNPNSSDIKTAGIPTRDAYDFGYVRDGRLFSYAHQLDATLRLKANAILEIGPGPGIVTDSLRTLGLRVTTLDPEPSLNPNVVGSVLSMPFANEAFDAALCCQVLEHLPLERFEQALSELHRVTRLGLVLSLPDVSSRFFFSFRLPRLNQRHLEWNPNPRKPPKLPPARHHINGHYWEIGYEGVSLAHVERIIHHAGWRIKETWRVPEKNWHRFFLLKKLPRS